MISSRTLFFSPLYSKKSGKTTAKTIDAEPLPHRTYGHWQFLSAEEQPVPQTSVPGKVEQEWELVWPAVRNLTNFVNVSAINFAEIGEPSAIREEATVFFNWSAALLFSTTARTTRMKPNHTKPLTTTSFIGSTFLRLPGAPFASNLGSI